MKSMYGESFPSLAHRLIYSYLLQNPEPPNPQCGVDAESQLQYQSFMRSVLEKLYEDPSLIGMPLLEDTLSGQVEKATLQDMRLKTELKFNQFFDFLIKLGTVATLDEDAFLVQGSSLKLEPRLEQLTAIGLCIQAEGKNFRITCPEFPAMLPAYWYHANRKHRKGKDSRRAFIWGYTRWQVETALECYGSYVPDATFFGSVEDYCRQHGYVCSNDEWDNRTVNWEKEYPKKKRILFSVFAQPWGQYQVMHTVRVSDFQIVFAEFASMSDGLKQMIMDKASRCSGCRYCVQTDKSGTKPLAASHVTHNGVDKVICSYYPFWSLREISSERADQLIELMSIAERVLADKYGARAK